MAVCQNLVPLVNIKIACKWMFIPLKMVLIGLIHTHISAVLSEWSQLELNYPYSLLVGASWSMLEPRIELPIFDSFNQAIFDRGLS